MDESLEIRNAKIKQADLILDGRQLTLHLTVSLSHGEEVFSLYKLDRAHIDGNSRTGYVLCCLLILAESEEWSELCGAPIRVGLNSDNRIIGIGNIIDEEWFNIDSGDNQRIK
jgi:hypothetical protein